MVCSSLHVTSETRPFRMMAVKPIHSEVRFSTTFFNLFSLSLSLQHHLRARLKLQYHQHSETRLGPTCFMCYSISFPVGISCSNMWVDNIIYAQPMRNKTQQKPMGETCPSSTKHSYGSTIRNISKNGRLTSLPNKSQLLDPASLAFSFSFLF